MLASALDSHPEIRCSGEYEMTEKFPIGRSPGTIEGCIVQSYHIDHKTAPKWLEEAKLMLLYRPLQEIARSLYYDNESGRNHDQHLEPVTRDKTRYIVDQNKLDYLHRQHDLLTSYAVKRGGFLYLTYEWITKGLDTRVLPVYAERVLSEFLDVDRHPLTPATYKPS